MLESCTDFAILDKSNIRKKMSIYYIDKNHENIYEDFDFEKDDPSLNDLHEPALKIIYRGNKNKINQLFFSYYGIEYLSRYFLTNKKEFRVVSYPHKTNTCYEKAKVLESWDPLNIIKALYLECSENQFLYAVVVPETGCFINKSQIAQKLDLPDGAHLVKAGNLPNNMTFGTCSPFIVNEDLLKHGGRTSKILFDTETLIMKKHDNSLDDFSFGLDHRFSVQMNYYQCYKMLKKIFGAVVIDEEILTLSFKEKFARKKGRIKIDYQFDTINYRTAKFINSIHGYGDVSIVNDYVDELELPNVLTASSARQTNNEERI